MRFHFALGALAYTLGSDASWQLVVGRRRRPAPWDELLGELMPFLVAGFEAPQAGGAGAQRAAGGRVGGMSA